MTEPVIFERSPWGLVVVTGRDATSFLQAIVSQDLDPVDDGETVASLLLIYWYCIFVIHSSNNQEYGQALGVGPAQTIVATPAFVGSAMTVALRAVPESGTPS